MSSFQVLLPENMRRMVDDQVKARGFKDASEYLCQLLYEDQTGASVQTADEELIERLKVDSLADNGSNVDQIKREIGRRRFQELQNEVSMGIDQADRGEAEPLEIDAIMTEVERRMAAAQSNQKVVG